MENKTFKLVCIPVILLIGIWQGCSQVPSKTKSKEEMCFIDKYHKLNAKMYDFVNNDSTRFYHIDTPKEWLNTSKNFGWFEFHVFRYKDTMRAKAAFKDWEYLIEHNSEAKLANKMPKYRIAYLDYNYEISTGCFNETMIDSVFETFKSCLDVGILEKKNIIRLKCGGDK